MASSSTAPAPPPSQEFVVRVQKNTDKKYGIIKFNPNNKVDFTKCNGAKIERENNVKDFKVAHNIDVMPKFGAGSEFGRDLKEEARRKKYGYYKRKYNVEDQAWMLKLGSGKTARNFKGTKEGGISDNASYYIFTQCPDGAFEAFPIDEWHNFNPVVKYKHLSAEEAEEQFSKREQILNYHTIMVQKRIKDDKDAPNPDDAEEKKASKSKKKGKDFLLTDMDEWANLSEDSGDDSDTEVTKSLKEPKKKKLNKKSGRKHNSDDEAVEESDEADEAREVDYMTDTDSDDDDMFANKERSAKDKYQEKGVEDEEALEKMLESDEENEDEKKDKKKEDGEDSDDEKAGEKKAGSGSDSSSSSDSDSDPEKEGNFASALFMPNKEKSEGSDKKDKKNKKDKSKKSLKRKGSFSSESSNSRCPTPSLTPAETAVAAAKSAAESPSSKKPKLEKAPLVTGIEGLSEDTVRRYLMRKPMTTKDLLQKFKNVGLPKEKLVTTIAEILKKINPEKNKIKDKLYLFIKQ